MCSFKRASDLAQTLLLGWVAVGLSGCFLFEPNTEDGMWCRDDANDSWTSCSAEEWCALDPDCQGDGGVGGDGDGDSGCTDPELVCEPAPGACQERLVCEGERHICDAETDTCVQCTSDNHCGGDVCDTDSHDCVGCLSDDDCDGAFCDDASQACVQCLEDAHCGDPAASRCDAGACVGCGGESAHCAHLPDTPVCDEDACVQCTGTDYDACGTDAVSGDLLVCDSIRNVCSDQVERSRGLCGQCVSDAQCQEGQLCVAQEFDGQHVGHFCLWQKGGAGGAPALCSEARPYFDTLNDVTSVDGTTANICSLAVSTCPAHADFRSPDVDCAPGGTPDDMLCGAVAGDAYCRQPDPMNEPMLYRCTVPCLSDDDCRVGSSCDIAADPPYCEL